MVVNAKITAEHVRVGKVQIALETAVDSVRDYTDAEVNATRPDPYAYPAYDEYERGPTIHGGSPTRTCWLRCC